MSDGAKARDAEGHAGQRLDKWLWIARVAKTRTTAARLVAEGKIRVNRVRVVKPSQAVKAGDVVTASVGPRVRVLRIVDFAVRRGPPAAAVLLYEELTVAADAPISAPGGSTRPAAGGRPPGSGRPTKRDRREIDRLKGRLG